MTEMAVLFQERWARSLPQEHDSIDAASVDHIFALMYSDPQAVLEDIQRCVSEASYKSHGSQGSKVWDDNRFRSAFSAEV